MSLQTQRGGSQRAHGAGDRADRRRGATRTSHCHQSAFKHSSKIANFKKTGRTMDAAQRVASAHHWVAWWQAGIELH